MPFPPGWWEGRQCKFMKIGFIGFGLIGGSLARIWSTRHPEDTFLAYNYHLTHNQDLEDAVSDGVLDAVSTDLEGDFADCDLIYLCSPILRNIEYLTRLKPVIKPSCILTDVGSVKGNIHQAVRKLGLEANFIGGHPMAGSEKTGYHSSTVTLFENAYYILTPTPLSRPEALSLLKERVLETAAIPLVLEPGRHDDLTAAISHVPHIIAAALVNSVRQADGGSGQMSALAAGGFRDITRIASSSPVMWQNICLANPESILRFLDQFTGELAQVKEMLLQAKEEELLQFFADSKDFRDSLPLKAASLLPPSYEVLLYIPDRPGSIAVIASLMAASAISIKNIGIAHNREYSEGVLQVEFYDQPSLEKAVELLKERNFTLY